MPPLFPLTLALYAVACTLYFVTVAQQPQRLLRAARLVLILGFCSQALDIGWLCMHGQSPPTESREAVFFASWLIVGVYLLSTLRTPLAVVATLVLPVALMLQITSRLAPAEVPRAASFLRSLHIFSATLGTAIFAVAAGVSVIYLLTERQLKRHHLGQLGRRGPALEPLDTLNRRAILLGLPVFSVALWTGGVFVARLLRSGEALGHILTRPQYALSILSWLIYGGLLVARVTAGMRGRRAAWLTLLGFLLALGVLGIYFLRGVREVTAP